MSEILKKSNHYEDLMKIEKNKVIDNFFRIWVTKSITSESNELFSISKSFLDERGEFNLGKYKDFLDFIIINRLFSDEELTSINYKSIKELDDSIIKNIVKVSPENFKDDTNFSEEINGYLGSLKEKSKIKGTETSLFRDYSISDSDKENILYGLNNYLSLLYNKGPYNINISRDIEKIINDVTNILGNSLKNSTSNLNC